MIKRVLLAAAGVVALTAAPANAVRVIATEGAFAAPAPSSVITVFDFNGTMAEEMTKLANAGFTFSATGEVGLRTGTVPFQYQMPMPGDNSQYVSVQNNSSLTIRGGIAGGYDLISLYVGSLDDYNSITVFDVNGGSQTFSGSELIAPATANSVTSYRISFLAEGVNLAGLTISSSTNNAAEFDNLVFAVPEPSTWALMLAGFGLVGMAMRSRRRRTSVVFG